MRIVKNTQRTIIYSLLLFTITAIISCNGCQNETQRVIKPEEHVNVKLERFEKELFSVDTTNIEAGLLALYQKYGEMYLSYARDIMQLKTDEKDTLYIKPITTMISYKPLIEFQRTVDSMFSDVSDIESSLSNAMSIYKQEFPKNHVPRFITIISDFSYFNINYDSAICIGLDMYMNKRYAEYYRAYEIPEFRVRRCQREYIVPNAISALAITKTESHTVKDRRFLATMITEGKVRYFVKALLPEVHDSIIMGYTTANLKWSTENEPQMWAYFIEKNLLYQNEPSRFMRYFNDGPFTSADGVPPESAPAIGTWTGLQIVRNYMKLHPEVTLQQLMTDTNFDKILKESKYRPRK
jgi:hypothetical protein